MSGPGLGKVAVVAVTYNSAQDVDGFLDSLDVLDVADELLVVIADNASRDDTLERIARHRLSVEVLETGGNLGYAAGINAGMARVEDDATVIVANPDVRLHAGFLEAALAATDDPRVGIVTPRLLAEDGRILTSLRRTPSVHRALAEAVLGGSLAGRAGWGETVIGPDAYARPADVEWATGALLVITPACRQRVGAWDESYFLYSEETDYLLRARDAGFTIRYEPSATASHRGGDLHANPELWATMTKNRVRLIRKRHGSGRTNLFWVVVLLNELIRSPRSRVHRHAARELLRSRRSLLRGGT